MSHVEQPPPTTQSDVGKTPHEVQPKSQQGLDDKKRDDGLDDDDGIGAVEDDTDDSVLQAELDRFLGPMTPAPRTAAHPSTSQPVPAAQNTAPAPSEPAEGAATSGSGGARVYGAGGGIGSAGRDDLENALEGGLLGTGNEEVEQTAVSQKRPRLLLLVVTYRQFRFSSLSPYLLNCFTCAFQDILILLFTLQAILIILNSIGPFRNLIYAGSSYGRRFFDDWKFAIWVTSVTCAALCIHLYVEALSYLPPFPFLGSCSLLSSPFVEVGH
jgi:hypothetical protein